MIRFGRIVATDTFPGGVHVIDGSVVLIADAASSVTVPVGHGAITVTSYPVTVATSGSVTVPVGHGAITVSSYPVTVNHVYEMVITFAGEAPMIITFSKGE